MQGRHPVMSDKNSITPNELVNKGKNVGTVDFKTHHFSLRLYRSFSLSRNKIIKSKPFNEISQKLEIL